jgi:hypothetical protein
MAINDFPSRAPGDESHLVPRGDSGDHSGGQPMGGSSFLASAVGKCKRCNAQMRGLV